MFRRIRNLHSLNAETSYSETFLQTVMIIFIFFRLYNSNYNPWEYLHSDFVPRDLFLAGIGLVINDGPS